VRPGHQYPLLADCSGSSGLSGSTKQDKPNKLEQLDNRKPKGQLFSPSGSRLYSPIILTHLIFCSNWERGRGMAQSEYVFQRVEDQRELDRLRMIEQVFDPASRRRLLGTGLQPGWRCLEVGLGAGSIMTWMSEVVGPTGQVVAGS
jgi:hypothetical protein